MALEITGNVRLRFIQDAVLLYLLDPVRGEPTTHGLDQDPHEIESPRDRLLKRKFLDSFALLCCTRKDRDSVSAACMEEGGPEGTVIRIASNAGVSEQTLNQLREIVSVLGKIASQVCDPVGGEQDILARIVRLDETKVQRYLRDIFNSEDAFQDSLSTIETILMQELSEPSAPDIQRFLEWVEYGLTIKDLPLPSKPDALIGYIEWAQSAKKNYIEFLKVAFKRNRESLPRWVCTIFKLGRYGVAARALVQLAFKLPALVNPMLVEPVDAPLITRFPVLEQELPLSCVLRRVIGDRATEFVPRLAQIWNTADPEGHFQRACSVDLVAHAEMQLVNFYNHNQPLRPPFRFIGVSKKSCYLCYQFIKADPNSFCVSSCHQKLYPSWIPPPATSPRLHRQRKNIIKKLSEVMESIAKHDLEQRLGVTRRPVPADSTAGVSLSGLTDLVPQRPPSRTTIEAHIESETNSDSTIQAESSSMSGRVEQLSPTPTHADADSIFSGEAVSHSTGDLSKLDSAKTNSEMVFHIVRSNNGNRQDIVRISDILNPSSNCASWAKLVRIMRLDDPSALAFNEDRDFLLVNDRIRVANDRQLLACIQYLQNSSILNVNAVVFAAEEPPNHV